MSDHTTQPTRIYLTGDCEGFAGLRDSLGERSEVEVIGWSENVAQASGVLAGGHLDCVLHATLAQQVRRLLPEVGILPVGQAGGVRPMCPPRRGAEDTGVGLVKSAQDAEAAP